MKSILCFQKRSRFKGRVEVLILASSTNILQLFVQPLLEICCCLKYLHKIFFFFFFTFQDRIVSYFSKLSDYTTSFPGKRREDPGNEVVSGYSVNK